MRALLLWADDESPNLGVRVLSAGTRRLLNDVWPGIQVDAFLRGFPEGPAPLRLGYKNLAHGIARRSAPASGWFAGYDVVVDTGGGDSFSDIYGLDRLALISAVRLCAVRAGTAVILGPQTIGPFNTRVGRGVAKVSLRGVDVSFSRDAASATYAQRVLRHGAPQASDVVFALPTVTARRPPSDVLFNVSGLLWRENPHVSHSEYRQLCSDVVRRLVTSGRSVRLLSHVLPNESFDADGHACAELAEMLADHVRLEVVEPTGLDDARAHIGASNLVVGARMHACLNALSLGVPALPLAYSRKFAPLMEDLGWMHSVALDGATADEVLGRLEAIRGDSQRARGVAEQGRARLQVVREGLQRLGAS